MALNILQKCGNIEALFPQKKLRRFIVECLVRHKPHGNGCLNRYSEAAACCERIEPQNSSRSL